MERKFHWNVVVRKFPQQRWKTATIIMSTIEAAVRITALTASVVESPTFPTKSAAAVADAALVVLTTLIPPPMMADIPLWM